MAVSGQTLRLGLALCAVAALSACDKPKWRGGPKPTEAAAPAPAAPPGAPAAHETSDSLPAAPAWGAQVLGKNLRVSFAKEGSCIGNTDAVEMRYTGAMPGTKIIGWGWDPTGKKVVERVVLVDGDFRIMGTGEAGLPRPDVTAARPDITSGATGWWAVTTMTKGPVDAYGVLGDGATVCKLGHIEF